MVADIFTGADIILAAQTIRQVTSTDSQTNKEIRKAMASGAGVISQVSGKSGATVTSFTSADIAGLLALNTNTFCSIGINGTSSTNTIPFKLRAQAGLFQASATNHPWITGSNAYIIPTTLEASQDADAVTMSGEVHWISTDGITEPTTDAASQTLAAQAFNAEYALCDVYLNTVKVLGVQSVRVNFGIEVVKPPLGCSSVYPVQVSARQVSPTIEITTNDAAAITGTFDNFTAMTSAVCYFKKRADAGVFVADITAAHCSLTFAAGLADTNAISASDNDDGTATLTFHGKTLTASAATAIP